MTGKGRSEAEQTPSYVTWPVCDSRGPRIGDDGCPRCRRPAGHYGDHAPVPEDGWGNVTWTDMLGESRRFREKIGWPSQNAPSRTSSDSGDAEL